MAQKSSAKSKKTAGRTLRSTEESGVSTKPRTAKRPGTGKPKQENTIMEDTSMERGEAGHFAANMEHDLMVPSLETAQESKTPSIAGAASNSTPSAPALPTIAGFDLSGMSFNQQYAIRNAVVLCDCSVQNTPERIFDVLGRNFADTRALMCWLRRIGKGQVADLIKGKDVVDAARKAAYILSRDLKEEIGKPVARW